LPANSIKSWSYPSLLFHSHHDIIQFQMWF
jgi:hypothetical protein